MTWRTLAEALESAIAKGFDGEQGVGAPQAVTEFEAEDRGGLDATPVTPPRKGTVPAHGNGKGRGKESAPASETGQRRQKEEELFPFGGTAHSGQEESRALPTGRCKTTDTASPAEARKPHATAVVFHLRVIEGGGRRAGGGGCSPAVRVSPREEARERGWRVVGG